MKRGVHLGQHVPPSRRTTASSHSAAIMLAQDIMDVVEPHDKHVSDATQLVDKGSPTAHQAATGAPALAHQTHVSASSSPRVSFDVTARSRGASQIRARTIRWNAMDQRLTTTCLRATEVPWNVGCGPCLA